MLFMFLSINLLCTLLSTHFTHAAQRVTDLTQIPSEQLTAEQTFMLMRSNTITEKQFPALAKYSKDAQYTDQDGNTLLHLAAANANVKAVSCICANRYYAWIHVNDPYKGLASKNHLDVSPYMLILHNPNMQNFIIDFIHQNKKQHSALLARVLLREEQNRYVTPHQILTTVDNIMHANQTCNYPNSPNILQYYNHLHIGVRNSIPTESIATFKNAKEEAQFYNAMSLAIDAALRFSYPFYDEFPPAALYGKRLPLPEPTKDNKFNSRIVAQFVKARKFDKQQHRYAILSTPHQAQHPQQADPAGVFPSTTQLVPEQTLATQQGIPYFIQQGTSAVPPMHPAYDQPPAYTTALAYNQSPAYPYVPTPPYDSYPYDSYHQQAPAPNNSSYYDGAQPAHDAQAVPFPMPSTNLLQPRIPFLTRIRVQEPQSNRLETTDLDEAESYDVVYEPEPDIDLADLLHEFHINAPEVSNSPSNPALLE